MTDNDYVIEAAKILGHEITPNGRSIWFDFHESLVATNPITHRLLFVEILEKEGLGIDFASWIEEQYEPCKCGKCDGQIKTGEKLIRSFTVTETDDYISANNVQGLALPTIKAFVDRKKENK